MHKLVERPQLFILLLGLLILPTCADDQRTVAIHLTGVEAADLQQVQGLRVTALHRDHENDLWQRTPKWSQKLTVSGDDAQLVTLLLPKTLTGDLLIGVDALDESGRILVSGHAVAPLSDSAESLSLPMAREVCSADGWCAEHPLPQGQALHAVWGSSKDSVWAVGDKGTILHYDGSSWNGVKSPTMNALLGLSGIGTDNLWAVGANGTVLSFGGTSFSPVASGMAGSLESVWTTPANAVWVVGDKGGAGLIRRYQSGSWTPLDSATGDFPSLTHIWGDGQSRLLAAGLGGTVLQWNLDGSGLASMNTMPKTAWRSIWGSSASDVYVAGDGGNIMHSDGTAWTPIQSGTGKDLGALWGSDSANVWAAGSAGSAVHGLNPWRASETFTTSRLRSLWGSAADDLWAVGDAGTLQHWNGAKWTAFKTAQTAHQLSSIRGTQDSASGLGIRWAVGDAGTILRWNGVLWERMPIDTTENVLDVFPDGLDSAWVVGKHGLIARWDGRSWQKQNIGLSLDLYALYGTSGRDLWAVGDQVIVHFDGVAWQTSSFSLSSPSVTLRAIWGSRSDDVWAVGSQGTVLHWDGTHWQSVGDSMLMPASLALLAVWGDGNGAVFVSGSSGRLLRWDGQHWSPIFTNTQAQLTGMWGRSSSDIWLSDDKGFLFHYNGSVPTPSGAMASAPLLRIWGDSQQHLYAVGAGGTILRMSQPTATRTIELSVQLAADLGQVDKLLATITVGGVLILGPQFELPTLGGRSSIPIPAGLSGSLVVDVTAYSTKSGELGAGRNSKLSVGSDNEYPVTVSVRTDCSLDSWCLSTLPVTSDLRAIWGSGPTDIWAVGQGGAIFRYGAGQTWKAQTGFSQDLTGVWGSAPADVWAAGPVAMDAMMMPRFALQHWDGSAWMSCVLTPDNMLCPATPLMPVDLATGWSVSQSSVFALSSKNASILTYGTPAGSWSSSPPPSPPPTQPMQLCSTLSSIWVSSDREFWAAGATCLIRRGKDTSWYSMALPDMAKPLAAVWGSSAKDVWIAGAKGTMYHSDGVQVVDWSKRAAGTTADLQGLWGSDKDDVWAVGGNGTLLHFNGTTWTSQSIPSKSRDKVLFSVWGSSATDVWIVGQKGTLLHYSPLP